MGIAERIKDLRKRRGLSQPELASVVGVDANTIWRWENNKSSPMRSLNEIASALDVSTAYLLGETDDTTPLYAPRKRGEKADFGIGLDDPAERERILQELRERQIRARPFTGEIPEPTQPHQILIPIIDQEACAGEGFGWEDVEACATDWLPMPVMDLGGPVGPKSPYAVRVSGDSMTGVGINDGSFVAINPNVPPVNGDIVYVKWKGRCSVKGFFDYGDRIELRPANPAYKSVWLDADAYDQLKVLGNVVRVIDMRTPQKMW